MKHVVFKPIQLLYLIVYHHNIFERLVSYLVPSQKKKPSSCCSSLDTRRARSGRGVSLGQIGEALDQPQRHVSCYFEDTMWIHPLGGERFALSRTAAVLYHSICKFVLCKSCCVRGINAARYFMVAATHAWSRPLPLRYDVDASSGWRAEEARVCISIKVHQTYTVRSDTPLS